MNKIVILLIVLMIVCVEFFSGCNEENNEKPNSMLINNFQITPELIQSGEIATLSWNLTGATTVSIDNNIGFVNSNGTIIIKPTQNTTYTLTAKNLTDTKIATIEIIVEGISPTNDVPEISWIQNDINNSIIIQSISELGLNWDNIQITGIATKPTGIIEVGDLITGCSGTIRVSWNGTKLLGIWTFSEDSTNDVPDIKFFMDDEYNQLVILSVSESGLNWDNIQITGIATKPTGIIEVGNLITGCSGTITVSWEGTSSLGTWFFSVENEAKPNISFTKTSNKIIVWLTDPGLDWNDFEVIYDDLTLVLFNTETGTTLTNGGEVANEGTIIEIGDYIYVEGAGILRLRHKPSNIFIDYWMFT